MPSKTVFSAPHQPRIRASIRDATGRLVISDYRGAEIELELESPTALRTLGRSALALVVRLERVLGVRAQDEADAQAAAEEAEAIENAEFPRQPKK